MLKKETIIAFSWDNCFQFSSVGNNNIGIPIQVLIGWLCLASKISKTQLVFVTRELITVFAFKWTWIQFPFRSPCIFPFTIKMKANITLQEGLQNIFLKKKTGNKNVHIYVPLLFLHASHKKVWSISATIIDLIYEQTYMKAKLSELHMT